MNDGFEQALIAIRKNVEAALQLSDLDRGLIEHAITAIEERDNRLKTAGIDNHRFLAGNTIAYLKNIRKNDSLRPGFQALVNQTIVLLTSYFSSGISQLFRAAVVAALKGNPSDYLRDLPLKLSVGELSRLGNDLFTELPYFVAETPGISFQDTKSISRTFKDFFEVDVPRDTITNNITAGMAFRHVLVHNGGIVDRSCIKQLDTARPRNIRPVVTQGEELNFTTDEVRALAHAMVDYIERLACALAS